MKRVVFAWLIYFWLIYFSLPLNFLAYAQDGASQSATIAALTPSPSVTVFPSPTAAMLPSPTGLITSTPSPTETPSPTLPLSPTPTILEITPTPLLEPTPSLSITDLLSPTSTPAPSLEESPISNPSAKNKLPIKIKLLSERNLQANEGLVLELANIEGNPIQTLLKRGEEEIEVTIKQKLIWGSTVLVVEPPVGLKPGKYTLQITDSLGTFEEQEFWWGVLAINFNKSIYLPGDTADIALAVLDEQGMMVCDASLELRIKNQELGIDDLLSTENGKITVNPECWIRAYVTRPDYEAHYQASEAGRYEATLTAQTRNGSYSVKDAFEVRESVPFDVERNTATRIYPPEFYPALFSITAFEDFSGTIEEIVPDSFTILPLEESLSYESIRVVPYSAPFFLSEESQETIDLSPPFAGSYQVTLGFGEQLNDLGLKAIYDQYGLLGHDGLDFGLPIGTGVLAADSGEVVLAEENGDYGQTVVLQHAWGRSYYGHLSEISLSQGERVEKGALLGLSGNSGLTLGAHLHFGIKLNKNDPKNGYYGKIDPLPYLSFPTVITETSAKLITWKVNLKKGDKVSLGYQYQTPSVSPQRYLLGPLTFKKEVAVPVSGNENPFVLGEATESAVLEEDFSVVKTTMSVIAFQELRQWQLAIDATDTLYANADVTTTDWISGTCTSNLWQCIDEGTASYNDSDYIRSSNNITNAPYDHTCTSSLADVETVTQIVFSFRANLSRGSGSLTVLYSTDGSTPSIQVGTAQTLSTTMTTYSRTASGLSLTKSQVDNLRVRFLGSSTAGGAITITASQYDLTYDPVVTGPTLDQLMRHGKWFNASGARQPFTF